MSEGQSQGWGAGEMKVSPKKTEALPLIHSQSLTFTLIVTHSAIVFLTRTNLHSHSQSFTH